MTSLRKASSTPPIAAMPADTANAYILAPGTLMPSAAAARSLVRTASSRRPDRPRRMLATISDTRARTTMHTMA